MDTSSIGARIKAAREKAGMTQDELAEALNLSSTHISVIERGVKSPSLDTFISIANTLHVSTDMLLRDVIEQTADGFASGISAEMRKIPPKEQERVYKVVCTLIETFHES